MCFLSIARKKILYFFCCLLAEVFNEHKKPLVVILIVTENFSTALATLQSIIWLKQVVKEAPESR